MYITRLVLEKIRCFEHIEIPFDNPGSPLVILGDNGDGKTTVLRSLAMGLCDESSAAALFRELPGEYVRRSPHRKHAETGDVGTITIDLLDTDGARYRTVTRIKALDAFEVVYQRKGLYQIHGRKEKMLSEDRFPWKRIFVSGYGAGTRSQGTADFQHYLAVDAVYPLFRYDVPLQNPELAIRRLVEAARGRRATPKVQQQRADAMLDTIEQLLLSVLDLRSHGRLHLTPSGIRVSGPWGNAELGELGDGYQATITWVLDLLAWWFLKSKRKVSVKPAGIRGIVLMDEVEQHLHPRWQRNIIGLLASAFPELQIIATTHSPLVASGCEGVPVHRLHDGKLFIDQPFGWLAEDVYEMMGLPSSRATPFVEEILAEFERIDMKRLRGKATPRDKRELRRLHRQLDSLPGTDPLRLTTELENIQQLLRHSRKSPKAKRS